MTFTAKEYALMLALLLTLIAIAIVAAGPQIADALGAVYRAEVVGR